MDNLIHKWNSRNSVSKIKKKCKFGLDLPIFSLFKLTTQISKKQGEWAKLLASFDFLSCLLRKVSRERWALQLQHTFSPMAEKCEYQKSRVSSFRVLYHFLWLFAWSHYLTHCMPPAHSVSYQDAESYHFLLHSFCAHDSFNLPLDQHSTVPQHHWPFLSNCGYLCERACLANSEVSLNCYCLSAILFHEESEV